MSSIEQCLAFQSMFSVIATLDCWQSPHCPFLQSFKQTNSWQSTIVPSLPWFLQWPGYCTDCSNVIVIDQMIGRSNRSIINHAPLGRHMRSARFVDWEIMNHSSMYAPQQCALAVHFSWDSFRICTSRLPTIAMALLLWLFARCGCSLWLFAYCWSGTMDLLAAKCPLNVSRLDWLQ